MSTIKIIGDAALSASIEFDPSGAVDEHVAASDPHAQYLKETDYTAADVLTKLLTVDGAGSGLDADLLDGLNSAAFLRASGAATGATSSRQVFTNGITAPSMRPASDSTTALQFQDASGVNSMLTLDSTNGHTGINVTPDAPLCIRKRGSSAAYMVRLHGDGWINMECALDTGYGWNYYYNGSDLVARSTGPGGQIFYDGSGNFRITTFSSTTAGNPISGSSTKLLMSNAGDVGIGTSSPGSKLHVAGTIQADGLRLNVTPTSETITPTHTITFSANGTNYKIPCVAA